jgi:hypothetical protein
VVASLGDVALDAAALVLVLDVRLTLSAACSRACKTRHAADELDAADIDILSSYIQFVRDGVHGTCQT